MTKTLIFLRHAHAPDGTLTMGGVVQGISAGLALRDAEIFINETQHSSIPRAASTAKIVTFACNGLLSEFNQSDDQKPAIFTEAS